MPQTIPKQRKDSSIGVDQRKRLAIAAARLMAEDGIGDYSVAKRKAAHRLGVPENAGLPENSEIEEELRLYFRLFQNEEQLERLAYLRQKARELMGILSQFNPYLTGSVLDGTAGRYAEIDIQLFADSAKDVEIFLVNRQIDFQHSAPRSERVEAVLTVQGRGVVANLIVYPAKEERVAFRGRGGKARQRARLEVLDQLLSGRPNDMD